MSYTFKVGDVVKLTDAAIGRGTEGLSAFKGVPLVVTGVRKSPFFGGLLLISVKPPLLCSSSDPDAGWNSGAFDLVRRGIYTNLEGEII